MRYALQCVFAFVLFASVALWMEGQRRWHHLLLTRGDFNLVLDADRNGLAASSLLGDGDYAPEVRLESFTPDTRRWWLPVVQFDSAAFAVAVPFWLLAAPSALALAWLWRRRKRADPRGFPLGEGDKGLSSPEHHVA